MKETLLLTKHMKENPENSHLIDIYEKNNGYSAARKVLKELYGKEPYQIRVGGSIPVMSILAQELGVHPTIFAFGLEDEQIHAPNEFFRLSSFKKGQLAYCKLFEEFGKI